MLQFIDEIIVACYKKLHMKKRDSERVLDSKSTI